MRLELKFVTIRRLIYDFRFAEIRKSYFVNLNYSTACFKSYSNRRAATRFRFYIDAATV